jgi:hypothetical protein
MRTLDGRDSIENASVGSSFAYNRRQTNTTTHLSLSLSLSLCPGTGRFSDIGRLGVGGNCMYLKLEQSINLVYLGQSLITLNVAMEV